MNGLGWMDGRGVDSRRGENLGHYKATICLNISPNPAVLTVHSCASPSQKEDLTSPGEASRLVNFRGPRRTPTAKNHKIFRRPKVLEVG